MSSINLSTIDQIIRDVAQAEIMPRFRKLAEGDVEMKGANDPVTVADKEAERHLTARLTDYLPGSVVVGEESFAADKSIIAHLGNEHPVWIIDPIDGTRNFVSGKPEFAVMVALVQNRKAIASWIHDPNSGDTVMAEQGSGVWLRGQRLKLAASEISDSTVGLVGSRVKKLIGDPALMPDTSSMPKLEIGSCASFDYPRLLSAEDGSTLTFANAPTTRAGFLLYYRTNPWDHVPGMLLHKEAGGFSADWAGNPYQMDNTLGGLLYAPDKTDWDRLHEMFRPLIARATGKTS